MKTHTILIGTNNQIDRSKTLKAIIDWSNDTTIINWLGNKSIDSVFNPNHFSITTDVVLVYTNNRDFNFIEFFLFHASGHFFYKSNIDFVFICRQNPFETTTEITKRFNIVNVIKKDGELNCFNLPDLSLIRIDLKIKTLIEMIEETQKGTVFSISEKEMFCNYYKKMIMHLNEQRYLFADHATEEILNQINVN